MLKYFTFLAEEGIGLFSEPLSKPRTWKNKQTNKKRLHLIILGKIIEKSDRWYVFKKFYEILP